MAHSQNAMWFNNPEDHHLLHHRMRQSHREAWSNSLRTATAEGSVKMPQCKLNDRIMKQLYFMNEKFLGIRERQEITA